jgi:translocation and assembly module TamB
MSTAMRSLRWIGLALLALVVVIVGCITWVVSTQAGTRWAFARASGVTNGALQAASIEGALAGPLTLAQLTYRDPKSGVDLAANRVVVDLAVLDLFGMTVHVVNAELEGIDLQLSEPTEPAPPKEDKPFTLDAPIDVIVDRFTLAEARVARDQQTLVAIDSATFAGHWIDTGIAIRELNVRSPQGEIQFAAEVEQRQYYEGTGRGQFRWQAGERMFAGSLEATGREETTNLQVRLTSPVGARIAAELRQQESFPWKFSLDAPTFDPREELLPGSSIEALAATFTGEGSLREGSIGGVLTINNEAITVERAHFAQRQDAIDLDSLIKLGGGDIAAKGTVQTNAQPVSADLKVTWREVVVPATLAGQALFTQGDIDFTGSAESYRANGVMKVGPENRVANLELKLQGSPQAMELEQFDVVQTPGRLALTGRIDLQPTLGWTVKARARQFDPGAFAAAWKGRLDFNLDTDGVVRESTPEGRLVLTDLRGRLRNRDLRGSADLTLWPGMVITGDLDLMSGQSRIELNGERSSNQAGEVMNAVATIEVPSVNDWLPDGGGDLRGRIEARGRWPDLTISGRLRGSSLHVATLRAESLALDWNVERPKDPSGNATLEATKLSAAGFEFATVRAQVEGDMKAHSLDFAATGEPLASAFFVKGARDGAQWSGDIERLTLEVKDAARLSLQSSVQVSYSPELVRISQACLAERDIRLCLQGDRAANGVMHARYELQNVPLGLANTFAPPSMPLRFEGTLAGSGNVESNAEGVFKGQAEIRSASGRIIRQLEATADNPEVLLTYDDFNLGADFNGPNAQARLSSRLNEQGSLQGRVALQGLAEPITNVDGELTASLPSLRVIELFAPQLANVQGQADLRAAVRGSLNDPQIEGEFRASNLAMDVPEVGMKLREGRLSVTPTSRENFKLSGGIASGPGRIDFDGEASTSGIVNVRVNGKQFQAADIPSANVVIDPDLRFERGPEQMRLSGAVNIPAATINLQKLPQKERTQNASEDVVIIDAKTQEEAQAEAVPLLADIKVTLGEKVTLAGYGLDAKVNGQLVVKEQPGSPTTGSGEVRVEGTYKAYGQDLTIRQGQLLFAGTPLDNPRLSIIAVREVEEVTAGFRVSGSAQNPQMTVFSEPAMGQSDALAYILTGKPISEIGSGEGEGDMLQTAARSLGTAAGGLLAKNIGKRLGVDEVGIKESEALNGGAALTVGQYLSPRLYLSYGVGLFEPGEVITLRYKLSKELHLEALNGPEDSRAGIEYRKER